MRKLTYATITGFILFAVSFVFITGLVSATNGIAAAEGVVKPIFPQPYYEILISLGIGFIPVADVIWAHNKGKETEASTAQSEKSIVALGSVMTGFVETLKQLKNDKTGRAGLHHRRKSGRYDPDPRQKRHSRGHRKGVEPAGLKRWRLAHTRRGTHDPPRRRLPSIRHSRRLGALRERYRRHAAPKPRGKLESILNKYGTALGALIGGIAGVSIGYNDYNNSYGPNAGQNYLNTIIGGEVKDKNGVSMGKRTPEISKLWGTNDNLWGAPRGPIDYLKYKFLGLESNGNFKGSAWVFPFWIGLAATVAAPLARLFTHKGQRFLRPLSKIGHGMLAVSTVGALALPGCPKGNGVNGQSSLPPPPPTNQNQMKIGGAF
jgi:hypothetical protein